MNFFCRNACEKVWGEELKDFVKERGKQGMFIMNSQSKCITYWCINLGTLVVRPDSGDPATVVVKVLEILGSKFGFTINSKGYKLLPPYIRIIQVDHKGIEDANMKKCIWNHEN